MNFLVMVKLDKILGQHRSEMMERENQTSPSTTCDWHLERSRTSVECGKNCPSSACLPIMPYVAACQLSRTFISCPALATKCSHLQFGEFLWRNSFKENMNLVLKWKSMQLSQQSHFKFRSSFPLTSVLLPVASCETSNVSGTSDGSEHSVEADSLPGVRVKRKSRDSKESQQETSVSPAEINLWIEGESGMDRLKDAYTFGSGGRFVNEDTAALTTMTYRTALLGFCVNIYTASLNPEKREKYLSRTEGAVKGAMRHKTEAIKMFKTALRPTALMSLAAVTVFHLPHIIATYRNETTLWEFALSAGLASVIISHGAKQVPKRAALGTMFGAVAGYMITGFLMQQGLSQEQRHLEKVKQRILEKRKEQSPTGDAEVL